VLTGIGIYFDLRNPPRWERPWADHYADSLDMMATAEQLGASAIWLTEHHFFEDGYLPQPLTMAAAVAARTSRVRIGTAVYLPLLRTPAQVAEEAAVVDIISGGRLDLGVGTGRLPQEFAAFASSMDRPFTRLEAQIREVRRLWDEKVTPAPVQRPLPLWGGFFGPRGARIAGRLNMGLLAADRRLLAPYRDGLTEGGHDPAAARMRALAPVFVADDPDAAWPLIKPHVEYQWDSYRRYDAEGAGQPAPPPADGEDLRRREKGRPSWFVLTDVSGAVSYLRALSRDLPLDEVYCWGTVAGLDSGLARRHVELLLREVLPRLQRP
jgi:alkanesulfonate monooxygenase SsuD/methylene tetrahydromethanopterin reductase-like flavin-dependent oxidoreductase (luciferase family)